MGAEGIGPLLPLGADAPGKQVGHQQVIQVGFIIAKGKEDVPACRQGFNHLLDGIGGRRFHNIITVEEPPQLIVQSLGCHHVHPHRVCPECHASRRRRLFPILILNDSTNFHVFKFMVPVAAKGVCQRIQRGGRGFLQIQLTGEHFNIFRSDVPFGNFQVEIGLLPADGTAPAQSHHAHPAGKLGFQANHGFMRIGGGVVEAVFVVHVKHQHRGFVVMNQPGKDHARQEGFARPGCTKNTRGALDKLCQVNTNRQALLAGVTQDEVALLPRFAKDLRHMLRLRQVDGGMVDRDGLDRKRVGVGLRMCPCPFRVFR